MPWDEWKWRHGDRRAAWQACLFTLTFCWLQTNKQAKVEHATSSPNLDNLDAALFFSPLSLFNVCVSIRASLWLCVCFHTSLLLPSCFPDHVTVHGWGFDVHLQYVYWYLVHSLTRGWKGFPVSMWKAAEEEKRWFPPTSNTQFDQSRFTVKSTSEAFSAFSTIMFTFLMLRFLRANMVLVAALTEPLKGCLNSN